MIKNILIAALLLLLSQSLLAATLIPGTYQLLDHPDGAVVGSQGPYGLRLDWLSPPAGVGPTFSTETNNAYTELFWDGSTSASIIGTLWNNTTNELWTVSHILTDIITVGGSNGGFKALNGLMTLTGPDLNVYTMASKQDSSGIGFYALGDNHRCGGHTDCGPLVGNGWLDENGTNDWLVQFTPAPVPVPAAFWLFLSAFLGFIPYRRVTK